jgi:Fic family protein
MLSFSHTPTIEKALKNLHAKIVEKYKDIEGVEAEEARYLNRSAFISNIGASTRIENAVLTDREIDWVDTTLTQEGKTTAFDSKKEFILNKLSKDKERSLEEVVGCRQMLSTIYLQGKELFPLTLASLRGLHYELLAHYPKAAHYAGKYKTSSNRVVSINHATQEERVVLDPAAPGLETETAMQALVDWYNQALKEHPWPILVATEFVFRFLAIHPFQDGNGRLGRGLFTLTLLQADDQHLQAVTPFLAIDRHIEQNRSMYYTVLQQASGGKYCVDPRNYHYEPVVWFFIKVIQDSLDDIDLYRKRYRNLSSLSETAVAVLQCFKTNPESRLKVSDIEQETNLPRRTVQYTLKVLTEQAFLQKLGQGAASRYQLVF